jgi:Microsomal signal peptidase 12 kDa subunit (SPC12)
VFQDPFQRKLLPTTPTDTLHGSSSLSLSILSYTFDKNGLRRTKDLGIDLLLSNSSLGGRRLGDWICSTRFYRCLSILVGRSRSICHCEYSLESNFSYDHTACRYGDNYLLTPCARFHFILQLCVPDWPFYNRNPIQWLDSVPDRRQSKST